MKNPHKSFLIIVTCVIILLIPIVSFAEVKEIISEGTYDMGDNETPSVAESRALLQAKRIAAEQAGTYVENYCKANNFQLTADEMQVLASVIMEVSILDKKRTVIVDGFSFLVKIKARFSTDEMGKMAGSVKEKSVVEDYKQTREAYDKSQKDIEMIKKQLESIKEAKKKIEAKIIENESLFQANELFEKGNNHAVKKEYGKSIEAYTSAMTIHQNNYLAYNNRGLMYGNAGQHDKAIEDYSKAININPNFDKVYNNRGISYYYKGQLDKAIEDYSKAIDINQNFDKAYFNRGLAYYLQGNMAKAVSDLRKSCDMGIDNGCKTLDKVLKQR